MPGDVAEREDLSVVDCFERGWSRRQPQDWIRNNYSTAESGRNALLRALREENARRFARATVFFHHRQIRVS